MILLIEDNTMLARCLRILLEPLAEQVVVAVDMASAQPFLEKAKPEDIVLVDLKLPDSPPLQTLCAIADWKRRPNPPRVVIITGTLDQKVIRAAQRSAADGVALKTDETGFFDTLRDFGLVAGCGCSRRCANEATVARIEREVHTMTGAPQGDQVELRTLEAAFRIERASGR